MPPRVVQRSSECHLEWPNSLHTTTCKKVNQAGVFEARQSLVEFEGLPSIHIEISDTESAPPIIQKNPVARHGTLICDLSTGSGGQRHGDPAEAASSPESREQQQQQQQQQRRPVCVHRFS